MTVATNDARRYCAIIRLAKDSNLSRVRSDIPKMLAVMQRYSMTAPEMAFRSEDGLLFGYFLKSARPVAMLRAEWENSDGTLGNDAMMAFEVGETFAGTEGFSRAWTWLQRQ